MAEEKIIEVNPGDKIIINVKSNDDGYFRDNYSISEFAKFTGMILLGFLISIVSGVVNSYLLGVKPKK